MMKDNTCMINKLKEIIKQKGLKYTKQREVIFETILNCDKHLDTEEIYSIILKEHPNEKIGIATIYRALVFLEDTNLISSIALGKNAKKYETNFKEHHDHLVCVKCNKIVEFVNEKIETEQEKIAKDHSFKLLNHTMYLYGICKDCQE
ncbi:MAG: Fur family transcriptional regulator [Campylobacterota bacterium]|nr:Fur family transcriptional regulator [Campylobacterota bacterium]